MWSVCSLASLKLLAVRVVDVVNIVTRNMVVVASSLKQFVPLKQDVDVQKPLFSTSKLLDCQSGISCFQHMGICQKTAFTACDLCSKYKCHERRCIDKICCDESYVRMLAKKSCEKEVLTESKLPPLAPSSSLMSAAATAESLPAAAAPVTTIMFKKSDDELLGMLNEERKQVTAHTNLTQNASIK